MTVTLCVLLTAVPGREQALVEYEDQVLELFAAHGARLLQRVRSLDPSEAPYEVQILEFPSEDALDAYMQDPARAALADQRDQAIATTQVLRVDVV
jgi:uncharacterized protein (DUF1330 family)